MEIETISAGTIQRLTPSTLEETKGLVKHLTPDDLVKFNFPDLGIFNSLLSPAVFRLKKKEIRSAKDGDYYVCWFEKFMSYSPQWLFFTVNDCWKRNMTVFKGTNFNIAFKNMNTIKIPTVETLQQFIEDEQKALYFFQDYYTQMSGVDEAEFPKEQTKEDWTRFLNQYREINKS